MAEASAGAEPAGASAAPRGLGAIFLVSGFAALLYQIVWQRALFAIYGINIEAVTVVVTAFMVGLGVGSLAGGALSRHPRWPALVAWAVILVVAGFLILAAAKPEIRGRESNTGGVTDLQITVAAKNIVGVKSLAALVASSSTKPTIPSTPRAHLRIWHPSRSIRQQPWTIGRISTRWA